MPSETPRAPVSGEAIVVDGDMLDTAVIELFRNLRKTVNDKPKPEMNAALAEQRRCIHLLRAIGAFIKETWREPVTDALGVRRYLMNLATRIEQLNDGAVHPMFVPVARRGGQPDQVEVWEGRMWASAAIECHMRRSGEHKRKGAAELIATQQPVLKRLMRHASEGRKVTRKELTNSLVSWHREFQQGNTNEIVQPHWQWFLDSLELPATPEVWTAKVNFCLNCAVRVAERVVLPETDDLDEADENGGD